jgi:amylosucrase
MINQQWLNQQVEVTRRRLFPRILDHFAGYAREYPEEWSRYLSRFDSHFPRLFKLLFELYHQEYDFFFYLEELLLQITQSWIERRPHLKRLDQEREKDVSWFTSNQMLGGVCYVDLFSGSLPAMKQKIPYFKELGLTYLHLMPLYLSPESRNDGGYAVSSYRIVDPQLGTVEDLIDLIDSLRREGISLALDFVFNHTSDEHDWALRALAGEEEYQGYYWMFPDRTLPDAYDRTLREIFPDEHPGSFSYRKEIDRWIWTTFHDYQWDLNYSNPAVFNRMVSEMLSLANLGVEILRLDAVAFIWKEMGTACENLSQAHTLIRAFNTIARIAAPALLFKSEAIVHPDEVIKYIRPDECQLSYNPLLMALLWESLATRKVELLKLALEERYQLPDGCAWINYIRSHDDIGWTFSDNDAERLGINGFDHRQFLNDFYSARFTGSFARGVPFQENLKTRDARISGTTASLAGLETAISQGDGRDIEFSIRRIILMHNIIFSLSGIPLIYLGDEVGVLNDYSYLADKSKANDSRWVHRPETNWEKISKRSYPDTLESKVYNRMVSGIRFRKENPDFATGEINLIDLDNPHVLGYTKTAEGQSYLILANFSEREQVVTGSELSAAKIDHSSPGSFGGIDRVPGEIRLMAYQFLII